MDPVDYGDDCSRPKPFCPSIPEQEPLQFKTLARFWHPDLGDPFGIMHWVLCYCEPVRVFIYSHVWPPVTSGVGKARFNLQRSSLLFSITVKRRLSRIRFSDLEVLFLFEHPVHRMDPHEVTRLWYMEVSQPFFCTPAPNGYIIVSLMTTTLSEPEISGKNVRHKACYVTWTIICFILMFRGLRGGVKDQIPILVQILHQDHVIRELSANISAQLEIAVQTEGRQRLSGIITVRKSCDTLQSVLSGGDALNPTKTGAGCDTGNETQKKNQRNILHDMAWGFWTEACQDLHMLLQSELSSHIATKDYQEGELRGQIIPLPYSGCGPGMNAEDAALNAHLHGFAELGEVGESSPGHKRVLKGFYGSEVRGSIGFIQVSTKLNPRGEIRGQVHIPNSCESGGVSLTPEEPEYGMNYMRRGGNASCARWAPDYDRKCSVCSCQKRTVICDPIVCPPLKLLQPVHLSDQCCPVCEGKSYHRKTGCYFDGDRSWKAAGTRWHPETTGEVHCEKVTCPRLTCSNPVRARPSDCCKQCPGSCKFGRHWYPNMSVASNVPPFGEMKCVTCSCVDGITQCRRQECTMASCSQSPTNAVPSAKVEFLSKIQTNLYN
ncbi:hypothetical protein GDO86_019465 [Hymenochirus boettgeri]|uniref:Chordin n=1 Tax=Hymenochirus boettgeri TaxID=247094 RepID=A0A8T2IAU0_9PIPI|nr:hypothetical protein GDO86_019465 [Hymenochirus boettgeri]